VVAPTTVYLVLVSIAGFATVGVWMSITASHFFHRRNFLRAGGDTASLAYSAPLFPLLPIAAFVLCLISLIGIGFDPTQATALYFGIPFVAACYAYFHYKYGRHQNKQKVESP
jgi:S-methylmethionine transporter